MKLFTVRFCLLMGCLLFSSIAFSETNIAVVNLGKAFSETNFSKDRVSVLQANPEYVSLNENIKGLEEEITTLQANGKANNLTWTEDQKKEHIKQLQNSFSKLNNLLDTKRQARRELDIQVQQVLIPVAEKIMEGFVKENNITLLVDSASVYAYSGSFDFTEALTKALNEQYNKPQQ